MNKTYRLIIVSLLTALVALATIAFRVPIPATKGYINLGDSVIFISALLFGARYGAIAGGVGSALADILSGCAVWAPFTFVIKGLEGLLVGYIYFRFFSGEKSIKARIVSMIPAGLWMAAGYFGVEVILYGAPAAFVELPGNLFQAAGSILIALPIVAVISKINLFKKLD